MPVVVEIIFKSAKVAWQRWQGCPHSRRNTVYIHWQADNHWSLFIGRTFGGWLWECPHPRHSHETDWHGAPLAAHSGPVRSASSGEVLLGLLPCGKRKFCNVLNLIPAKWRAVLSLLTWKFWKIRNAVDPDEYLGYHHDVWSNQTARTSVVKTFRICHNKPHSFLRKIQISIFNTALISFNYLLLIIILPLPH